MGNLDKSFATTVDNSCGNSNGFIVEGFIKPRSSTIFGHATYSLGGPGLSIAVSGLYEDFSTVFLVYGWMLHTNQYAQSMEVLRTKSE